MVFPKRVEIFGDSLMKGTLLDGAKNRYRFAPGFIERFQQKFQMCITNRAKFGCTVEKGASILSKSLADGLAADAALLEYGGNDCDFDWAGIAGAPDDEHLPKTPLDKFVHTLKDMAAGLSRQGIAPVIMSLPPINAERYFGWIIRGGLNGDAILKWLGDIQLIYRHQELYSLAATRVAYETGNAYVDVRSYFLEQHNYADYLCDDGIHPNEKGYGLIELAFSNAMKVF